jgi:hypothetical protein
MFARQRQGCGHARRPQAVIAERSVIDGERSAVDDERRPLGVVV